VKTQTNQIREGENYQPITKRWREVTTIAAAPATERMMMSPRRLKHHHLLLVGLHLDRRFGFGVIPSLAFSSPGCPLKSLVSNIVMKNKTSMQITHTTKYY
jgi:hypothetical protein